MTTILRSDDLTCPSCVAGLEKTLKGIDGVETATVHFTSGRIEVHHDVSRVGADVLIRAVGQAGYRARPSNL
jgi:copper chaperone